ncbi:MAG: tetratricopeptide repeat protein [Coxiellaceae bacterium]|nr:tetratricopeptide repeat protein [Coxiellaceae bacterium]
MMNFWLSIVGVLLVTLLMVFYSLKRQPMLMVILALAIPFLSLGAYFQMGASKQVATRDFTAKKMADVQQEIQRLGSRNNVITMLKSRVEQNPSNPKGWYLLGKLSLGGGDIPNAITYFEKAHHLDPDNTETTIGLAEAYFYQEQGALHHSARQMLQEVLQKDQQNVPAMSLLASSAFRLGNYQEAINYWEQMLPMLDPQSKEGQAVLKMMQQARERL